jgi:hypothetical protein
MAMTRHDAVRTTIPGTGDTNFEMHDLDTRSADDYVHLVNSVEGADIEGEGIVFDPTGDVLHVSSSLALDTGHGGPGLFEYDFKRGVVTLASTVPDVLPRKNRNREILTSREMAHVTDQDLLFLLVPGAKGDGGRHLVWNPVTDKWFRVHLSLERHKGLQRPAKPRGYPWTSGLHHESAHMICVAMWDTEFRAIKIDRRTAKTEEIK